MTEAWRTFRKAERPIGSRDVACRTGMGDNQAQKCICRLLAGGCIEFVAGSARTGRLYRAVKGAAPPQVDLRGKTPAALAALSGARQARRHASRPAAQFAERPRAVPLVSMPPPTSRGRG